MGRRGQVSPVCNRATISLGRFVSHTRLLLGDESIQSPAQPTLREARTAFPHPGPWRPKELLPSAFRASHSNDVRCGMDTRCVWYESYHSSFKALS